jgi:hypothetical protein
MATRLGMIAETHDLFHPDHIGGRPQQSAIDAAMVLVYDIMMGKSNNLITTALLLDVCGVFDNVSTDRLLQTLHQLSCLGPVVAWCTTFLVRRSIALSLDGQPNKQRLATTGILQGSPASPILFLLYL